MANSFGTDILIQSPDPQMAADFYGNYLNFTVSEDNPIWSASMATPSISSSNAARLSDRCSK